MHRSVVTVAVALAMTMPVALAGAPEGEPFAACRERFAREPDNYDSAYCFYEVTFQQRRWDDGGRLFGSLIARHPDNLWLPLAYGHVFRSRDPERAEALYRRAASGFQAAGHAEGEILARSNLRNLLFSKDGRAADAAREVQRVAAIAASTQDPLIKARAWTLEATHLQESGDDLGVAYRLLKQTEAVVFPDGPYRLQRTTLIGLGGVAYRLGHLDDALATFRRLDALAGTQGEMLVQANARYNILTTAMLREQLLPAPGAARTLVPLATDALATAAAAGNRDITLKTHRALAELLAADSATRSSAIEHATSCVALAVSIRQPDDEAICAWMTAALLREHHPARARAMERQAIDADARANSPVTHAYTAGARMRWSWETQPRVRAIQESSAALQSIEHLRTLQETADSSAELFSTWTSHYYWLSGRLLHDARPGDLDLALTVTERMRARALLDSRDRSRAARDADAVARRQALRDAIASVQRQLLDPSLGAVPRRTLLSRLDALELDEREAQRLVSQSSTTPVHPGSPVFASLAALQSVLAPDEALLSFQVGLWETYDAAFGGGSWLIVITQRGSSAHRLPDRTELASRIPIFVGLLERQDDVQLTAAARLYDDLLADGLRTLPRGINRLVVIPDGALHRLPFDALRPAATAEPLAARYEVTVAPSATLWLRSRHEAPPPPTRRALAFADPVIEGGTTADASLRNAALQAGLQAGRLPYARRESRAMADHLGAVDAFVGAAASERALKETDLRQYGILHFAVHAIADEARPSRSALLLAPGGVREDGLLQAREIEALGLDGRVVVLSACQTAAGAVLSGEGVLSLARAFFGAGAVAVVGNRWPIRDEDASLLFEAFYRAVGSGASLSAALQDARLAAMRAGRPPSVWAGLVLLGNGDVRPLPHGRADTTHARFRMPVLGLVALLLLALVVSARTRSRHPRPLRESHRLRRSSVHEDA